MAALQDNYWKVRAAGCTAVSCFGLQMAAQGLPLLMKLLKEGQQSKQMVAETIIALGPQGEQQLIALIKQSEPHNRLLNNSKAKENIIRAFALADIQNPNIDFVIEMLFYTYSKEQHASIRKAAIVSLDILHKRSQQLQMEQAAHGDSLADLFYQTNGEPDRVSRHSSRTGTMSERPFKKHFNTYLLPSNLMPFF